MSEALNQSINLYQPIFRPKKQMFTAVTMLQTIAVFIVALITVHGFGVVKVGVLEQQAIEFEGAERAKSVQLASLDTTGGQAQRDEIERELDALNATLEDQQRLIEALQSQPPGSTEGFSRYLHALSVRRHPQVWLTRIVINGSPEAIELTGQGLSAGTVPDYLAALSSDEALQGQRFDNFFIERQENGELTFVVSGADAATPEEVL